MSTVLLLVALSAWVALLAWGMETAQRPGGLAAVEWLMPLRGRWLRIFAQAVLAPLLVGSSLLLAGYVAVVLFTVLGGPLFLAVAALAGVFAEPFLVLIGSFKDGVSTGRREPRGPSWLYRAGLALLAATAAWGATRPWFLERASADGQVVVRATLPGVPEWLMSRSFRLCVVDRRIRQSTEVKTLPQGLGAYNSPTYDPLAIYWAPDGRSFACFVRRTDSNGHDAIRTLVFSRSGVPVGLGSPECAWIPGTVAAEGRSPDRRRRQRAEEIARYAFVE